MRAAVHPGGGGRFNCIFCASFIHDQAHVEKIRSGYERALTAAGASCVTAAEDKLPTCIAQEDALVYFVLTGGVENQVLDLWRKRQQYVPGRPVFLVAHPLHNSLPASLEILARFRQDGVAGEILYLNEPADKAGMGCIISAVHMLNVHRQLAADRIGMIGEPSPWLIASSPDPELIRRNFGPEVVRIPMQELAPYASAAAGAAAAADEFRKIFPKTVEPKDDDLLASARIYLGLKALVEKHELTALTVRCFDFVLKNKATGCLALARLNDEGIIAGCEADLVSLTGMLWAFRVTGSLPWMANPSHIIPADNILSLAHCTVPSKLVTNLVLRSHFESGLGIGVQGDFEPGPVTLLRLGGADMKSIWLAQGEIIEAGRSPDLCRTQLRVRLDPDCPAGALLKNPLGNHMVVIPGRHVSLLREAWPLTVSV